MKRTIQPQLSVWIAVVWAMLGAFLVGCTSVKIQANKDSLSVTKITRLFVLINNGSITAGADSLAARFSNSLQNALTNDPVQLRIEVASPLELDPRAHEKEIKAFDPSAVLTVTATGGVLEPYGTGYMTIIYDCSLLSPNLEKRIWRARIDNSGGTALMTKRMREMADTIVSQLRRDGFL